jgi:hypothetical protein
MIARPTSEVQRDYKVAGREHQRSILLPLGELH